MAQIILLPAATASQVVNTFVLRHGECDEQSRKDSLELLDEFSPLFDENHRSIVATARSEAGLGDWLQQHGVRDAMMTALQSQGVLLGAVTVGNRLGDVGTFDAADTALFEAF